jgi:hypothetical protein
MNFPLNIYYDCLNHSDIGFKIVDLADLGINIRTPSSAAEDHKTNNSLDNYMPKPRFFVIVDHDLTTPV